MLQRLWSTDWAILGYMSYENDWFLHLLSDIHTHLCHDAYLWYTPRWAIQWWRREDWERVDDYYIGIRVLYSRNDSIKIWFRHKCDSITRNSEPPCTSRYLSNMLFPTHIEDIGILVPRIPLCHLESKGRLPDSWLPWEEHQRTTRESSSEDAIELMREAWIPIYSWRICTSIELRGFQYSSSSYFWFFGWSYGLYVGIPLSTCWTFSSPFWRCRRTVGTDIHRTRG